MKTQSKFLFILVLSASLNACKKSETNDPAPVTPTVLPDTLGTGWRKVTVASSEVFADIFFNTNSTGYLAGKKLYKSVDGGNTWTAQLNDSNFINIAITPDNKGFFANNLTGLWQNSGGLNNFSNSIMTASTGYISDVFFPDNNNGYYINRNTLSKTSDGGATWSIVSNSFPGNPMATIFFLNSTIGWLAAGPNVYRTNGTIISAPAVLTLNSSINAISSLYAVTGSTIYAAGTGGEIFKSTDGGVSFNLINTLSGGGGGFTDIHFLDANNGYACSSRFVYKTTDGGTTWNKVVSMGNTYIVELHFADSIHGWACGGDGTVLIFN